LTAEYELDPDSDYSVQIAESLRNSIVDGRLLVDQRLPSEAELSDLFSVSRPTIREALKRLAAQNLIRTRRGATGGAFVNRQSYKQAYRQQITTATLLLGMNDVTFETAVEARYTLERSCVELSAQRRKPDHLATMRAEIHRQGQPGLSDESFCDSDVAFHRALVDGAGNPILSFQLAGAVEAMQPLMNMITFTARNRAEIIKFHTTIANALEAGDSGLADQMLVALSQYTVSLADKIRQSKAQRKSAPPE